ncbi:molybdopterin dinucleotide binding domain-containing protein [Streptomyces massasporeus]|uniref:molybdopterin dinucleotide binding domain-containing protein n=1 Tax=Streptomyces massasporeus TaxID=67324 RepID=UPI003F54041E
MAETQTVLRRRGVELGGAGGLGTRVEVVHRAPGDQLEGVDGGRVLVRRQVLRGQISPAEASVQGLADGDLVQVTTPRGAVRARLRTNAIRDGMVFLPFHYGYGTPRRGIARPTAAPAVPPTRPPSPTGTRCQNSPCSRPARPASPSSAAARTTPEHRPRRRGAAHDRHRHHPAPPPRRRT